MSRVLAPLALACSLTTAGACATAQSSARPEAFPRTSANRPAATESVSTSTSTPAPTETALPASPLPPPVLAPAAGTAAILQTAFDLIGTPYKFGGTSPDTGFDCSGFVGYVMRQHAIQIPRTVAEQFEAGRVVPQDDIQAGDLVFFTTTGPGATHVGMVISTGAKYEFIHAPADGSRVRIERFDTGYWQRRWLGARRVF